MVDEVILNKSMTIQRCIARVKEEYDKDPATFSQDYTRQDAAVLNIQRACEAALDMGQRVLVLVKAQVPQSMRDIFTLLEEHKFITADLANRMKRMIGFRNVAVHDYQALLEPIVEAIIREHLQDFAELSHVLLTKAAEFPAPDIE